MKWRKLLDICTASQQQPRAEKAYNHALSSPPEPMRPLPTVAERQNRSFDQWCQQGRGRDCNQEL